MQTADGLGTEDNGFLGFFPAAVGCGFHEFGCGTAVENKVLCALSCFGNAGFEFLGRMREPLNSGLKRLSILCECLTFGVDGFEIGKRCEFGCSVLALSCEFGLFVLERLKGCGLVGFSGRKFSLSSDAFGFDSLGKLIDLPLFLFENTDEGGTGSELLERFGIRKDAFEHSLKERALFKRLRTHRNAGKIGYFTSE